MQLAFSIHQTRAANYLANYFPHVRLLSIILESSRTCGKLKKNVEKMKEKKQKKNCGLVGSLSNMAVYGQC